MNELNKLAASVKSNWVVTVITALLALVGLTVSVTQTDSPTPNGGHSKTITFKVDKSVKDGSQPATVTIPANAPKGTDAVPADAAQPLAVAPPEVRQAVPGQIDAANAAELGIKATLPPLPTAGASIEVPGCRTMFINSFSSRHGVRPVQFWLHYTASPNVPGWADVLSIVHYFEHVQASAHFVIDREGNCAYIVPIEQKAWTQMAANAFGINFEIIDRGTEPSYLDTPGYKKLASVLKYLSPITGIPIRKGAVNGCAPTRSGIVTHWMGGLCSGGHVDLKPYNIDQTIRVLQSFMGHPKPAKKVVWIKHRRQIHTAYQKDCSTKALRKKNAKECSGLRVHARQLDKLIARKR